MAISVEQALASYGYVYTIANAIPDLKKILQGSIQAGDTADALAAKIESSPWWMNHGETVRNLVILKAREPATYNQNLSNAKDLIKLKAQQLGRTYSDSQLSSLALRTLTENPSWDDSRLNELVSNSLTQFAGQGGIADTRAGTAATYQDKMRQLSEDYGVPLTQKSLDSWTQRIQAGADTIDGFTSVMMARAKATYPPLADQIDAGMTVRDIADPYVQTMAQTLELPQSGVTLNDPYIQKALTARNVDGTATVQPLWQFTRALKDDPRYDHTTQAKQDAFSTLAQVGKDWGFSS